MFELMHAISGYLCDFYRSLAVVLNEHISIDWWYGGAKDDVLQPLLLRKGNSS
jgi:hypothetical protein